MQETLEKVISATVPVKDLRSALKVISKVMHKNPIVPALDSVIIEIKDQNLLISASDLLTAVFFTLPLEEPSESVIFTIEYTRLNSIVKFVSTAAIKFDVSTDEDYKRITISWDDTSVTLKEDIKYLDMPKFPSPQDDFSIFDIGLNQLREGLRICKKMCSTDDLRPAMTGVYFDSYGDSMKIVATDGHRLACYQTDVDFNFPSFIVQKSFADVVDVNTYAKCEFVNVQVGKTTVTFIFDNCSVITHKMDETYPDYMNAIPDDGNIKVLAPLNILLNRLDLARAMSNEYTHWAAFNFSKDQLCITTHDLDYDINTNQILSVKSLSEISDVSIGFNVDLLKKSLHGFTGDLEIEMSAPHRAALFYPKTKFGKSLTLLLMPVLLNNYE